MYIGNIDSEKQEILISSGSQKKEIIICALNIGSDRLEPSHVQIIENKPFPNRKITITAVENGYIITYKNNSSLSLYDSWGNELSQHIDKFLNEDEESVRDLTDDELEDTDFLEALNDLNEGYQKLKQ